MVCTGVDFITSHYINSLDIFETEKYLGPQNVTGNYWNYQRVSLEEQTRYISDDVIMLVVHGMDDQVVNVINTMKLTKVIMKIQIFKFLKLIIQDLTANNFIFQQQVSLDISRVYMYVCILDLNRVSLS